MIDQHQQARSAIGVDQLITAGALVEMRVVVEDPASRRVRIGAGSYDRLGFPIRTF